MANIFYDNKEFYSKAFHIIGQNSFTKHFHAQVTPLLEKRISKSLNNPQVDPFVVSFLNEATISAFKRWLTSKDIPPAKVFSNRLRSVMEVSTKYIYQEILLKEDFSTKEQR